MPADFYYHSPFRPSAYESTVEEKRSRRRSRQWASARAITHRRTRIHLPGYYRSAVSRKTADSVGAGLTAELEIDVRQSDGGRIWISEGGGKTVHPPPTHPPNPFFLNVSDASQGVWRHVHSERRLGKTEDSFLLAGVGNFFLFSNKQKRGTRIFTDVATSQSGVSIMLIEKSCTESPAFKGSTSAFR